jgi:aspartate racemase
MKRLGIVGGIGPESTVYYYKLLVDLHLRAHPQKNYPETVIYTINMTRMEEFIGGKDFEGLGDYLLDAVRRLRGAGADIGIIASNTPHVAFPLIEKRSPIPLVSIVEATRAEADRRGLRKLLLLGTAFTMSSGYYGDVFDASGIQLLTPSKRDILFIHRKIMDEIEEGILREETREAILNIVKPFRENRGIEGVILGCTELPLLFPEDALGLPFLDTSRIHVESAFRRLAR